MSEQVTVRVVIDEPLVKYFEEGMARSHVECSAEEELTEFLAMILNDTMYPMSSRRVGEREIHLTYRPKAYADPIF